MEISHLFSSDDTLIFCQPDEEMILNLRCVLLCFQAVLGSNINLNKSELVKLGNRGDGDSLVAVLGCKAAQLPIKSLDFLWEVDIKM